MFAVAVLDMDQGISFVGPLGDANLARDFLHKSGIHAHVHCEIVALLKHPAMDNDPAPQGEDHPHIVMTGTLTEGYNCYGPFNSLESAEQASGLMAEYTYLMPLEPTGHHPQTPGFFSPSMN